MKEKIMVEGKIVKIILKEFSGHIYIPIQNILTMFIGREVSTISLTHAGFVSLKQQLELNNCVEIRNMIKLNETYDIIEIH